MIAIYTDDPNFKKFVESSLSVTGIIPIFFNEKSKLTIFKKLFVYNFLLFMNNSSNQHTKDFYNDLIKIIPCANVSVAVDSSKVSASVFREIDNVNNQIFLPCNETTFLDKILKYFSFENSFGALKTFEQRKDTTLLGYPLSLSKKDYFIVKLLVLAKENAIHQKDLSNIIGMTENCLSVHVSNINAKAKQITDRKLIIHTNEGYKLNPYM